MNRTKEKEVNWKKKVERRKCKVCRGAIGEVGENENNGR